MYLVRERELERIELKRTELERTERYGYESV